MKKGQGWARRVTLENLPDFAPWLRQADDKQAELEREKRKQKKAEAAGKPSPFRGVPLSLPSRFRSPQRTGKSGELRKDSARLAKPKMIPAPGSSGVLLWRRTMSRSDAQKTSGKTNPTGCLRFTQAWRDNEREIDQTSFFRQDIFGRFPWRVLKAKPYEEATDVPFHVTLNGEPLGIFALQIRHKPSGEAGQHNYTTSLHWGKLMPVVKEKVRPGQVFSLSAPAKGKRKPFYIEIA